MPIIPRENEAKPTPTVAVDNKVKEIPTGSGAYRQMIGPAKTRLNRYIGEFNEKTFDFQKSGEDRKNWLIQTEGELAYDHTRIKNTIGLIQSHNDKWIALKVGMDPDQRAAEEPLYSAAAEGDDGFITALENGWSTLDVVEAKLAEVRRYIVMLDAPSARPQLTTSLSLPSPQPESSIQNRPPPPPVQLPTLKLERFDGNPLHWDAFWDFFEGAVHNQNIPKAMKLSYLLSCLDGKAKSSTAGFKVTNDNYDIILDILRTKFGSKDVLRKSLHHELQAVPRSNSSVSDTRRIFDKMEMLLRQMDEAKEDTNHPNIASSVESKLPDWVLMEIYKLKRDDITWNVQKMRKEVEHILQIREEIERLHGHGHTQSRPPDSRRDNQRIHAPRDSRDSRTTTAMSTATHGRRRGPKKKYRYPCAFCGSTEHANHECDQHVDSDSRIQQLKKNNGCLRCCSAKHVLRECKYSKPCKGCSKIHSSSLCPVLYPSATSDQRYDKKYNQPRYGTRTTAVTLVDEPKEANNELNTSRTTAAAAHNRQVGSLEEEETTVLLTRDVVLTRPDGSGNVPTLVFFDQGADDNFIRLDVIEELKLKPSRWQWLKVSPFGGGKDQKTERRPIFELGLRQIDGSIKKIQAYGYETLTDSILTFHLPEGKNVCDQIRRGMKTAALGTPGLLVGAGDYADIIEGKKVCKETGFKLYDSTVGPMLSGRGRIVAHTVTKPQKPNKAENKELAEALEKFHSLELLGIKDSPYVDDDEEAMKFFTKTLRKVDGKYEVRLPYKSANPKVDSNYRGAMAQLRTNVEKLQRTPEKLSAYDATINDHIQCGFVEVVDDPKAYNGILYYLPHHAVESPDKETTKTRLVFNGSAHARGEKSLNDELFRGPVMLKKLIGMLLKLRNYPILVSCDVEKFFHMVGLHPMDRDACRFLWLRDPSKGFTSDNVIVLRFKVLPFGLTPSPFLSSGTLDCHLKDDGSALAQELRDALYADNGFLFARTPEEAVEKFIQSRQILARAGMNLREAISNNGDANKIFKELGLCAKNEPKILGLPWDIDKDTLSIKFPSAEKLNNSNPSKRSLLKKIASVYDPMGLVSPSTLVAKLLMQKLWKRGLQWDEELNDEDILQWNEICSTWQNKVFKIPRLLHSPAVSATYELLIFTDSSANAYASSAFIRQKTSSNSTTRLAMAKSRLAPLKPMTIPKLELVGALTGTRLARFILEHIGLPVERCVLWSDSKCVLYWIANDTSLQPRFIDNRLVEIRSSPVKEFFYVNTSENPADIGTRGMDPEQLAASDLWWNGPHWIEKDELWPKKLEVFPKPAYTGDDAELGEDWNDPASAQAMATTTTTATALDFIDWNRFSDWNKLVWMVAYVLFFARLLLVSIRKLPTGLIRALSAATTHKKPHAEYVRCAETQLILQSQSENPPNPEVCRKLGLKRDKQGVLRCNDGRLGRSELQPEAKNPIYLPRDSKMAELLVLKTHRDLHHAAGQSTLAELRQNFWVIKGRSYVKKVLKQCYRCKRFDARPYRLPPMSPLPEDRSNRSKAYQACGFDNMGPIVVRRRVEKIKIWVALITCMTTRLVHMEVIEDLSTEACIHALTRFFARRGRPDRLVSDNATTFHLADKTLAEIWTTGSAVDIYCAKNKISWDFNPQRSAWYGGFFERLIKDIKNSLRRTVGRSILTVQDFTTLVVQLEGLMNCRPLTYLNESLESSAVLRPIDFIQPHCLPGLPPIPEDSNGDEEFLLKFDRRSQVQKSYNLLVNLLDKYWTFWRKEYLVSLRERHQLLHKQQKSLFNEEPRLGEVVLVDGEELPRGEWRLGIIVELVPSRDNEIRVAKVRMSNGKIFNRTLNLLYPMEIQDDTILEDYKKKQEVAEKPTPEEPAPRRSERLKAKEQRTTTTTTSRKPPFFVYPLLSLVLMSLLPWIGALECPKNVPLRILDRPLCSESGLVVQQLKEGWICWNHVKCQNNVDCLWSPKCDCPKWADACSNYYGPSKDQYFFRNPKVAEAIEAENPPEVCSLDPSKACSEKRILGTFPKIELFDHSTHIVRQLQLVTKDFLPDEFECVGNGNIVSGSPHYCETHECADRGTKFCYHRQPSSTFILLGGQEIMIKAWGYIQVHYSPHKSQKPIQRCANCTISCVEDGLEAILESGIDKLEIVTTANNYLISKPHVKQSIPLHREELLAEHEVTVKVWSHDEVVHEWHATCPAKSICHGDWSILEYLLNFCSKRISATFFGVSSVIALLVLKLTISVLKTLWCCLTCGLLEARCPSCCGTKKKTKRAKKMCRLSKCCLPGPNRRQGPSEKKLKKMESEQLLEPEPTRTSTSSKFKPFRAAEFFAIAMLLLPALRACSETRTLTATEESCTRGPNSSQECGFSTTTLVTDVPRHQELCFMLQRTKTVAPYPVGTLKLKLKPITYICDPIVHIYTRAHHLLTTSAKRCFLAGSCSGQTCENLARNGSVLEFGRSINSVHGLAYCVTSPGGPFQACGLPMPGCLFYKIYPQFLDHKIHRLVSCNWRARLRIKAELYTSNGTKEHYLEVAPGTSDDWLGLKVTLESVTPPQMASLKILTDGRRATLIDPVDEAQLYKFHCPTFEDALASNCLFEPTLCDCSILTDKANCQCRDSELEKLYNPNSLLPLLTNESLLQVDFDSFMPRIWMNLPETAAQIQISIQDFRLTSYSDKTACQLDPPTLEGCYGCYLGSKLRYRCSPDFGSAVGHATCESTSFSLVCDGRNRTLENIHFDHAEIIEQCTLLCPASMTMFKLQGRLEFVVTSAELTPSNGIFLGFGGISLPSIFNLLFADSLTALTFVMTIGMSFMLMLCWCRCRHFCRRGVC